MIKKYVLCLICCSLLLLSGCSAEKSDVQSTAQTAKAEEILYDVAIPEDLFEYFDEVQKGGARDYNNDIVTVDIVENNAEKYTQAILKIMQNHNKSLDFYTAYATCNLSLYDIDLDGIYEIMVQIADDMDVNLFVYDINGERVWNSGLGRFYAEYDMFKLVQCKKDDMIENMLVGVTVSEDRDLLTPMCGLMYYIEPMWNKQYMTFSLPLISTHNSTREFATMYDFTEYDGKVNTDDEVLRYSASDFVIDKDSYKTTDVLTVAFLSEFYSKYFGDWEVLGDLNVMDEHCIEISDDLKDKLSRAMSIEVNAKASYGTYLDVYSWDEYIQNKDKKGYFDYDAEHYFREYEQHDATTEIWTECAEELCKCVTNAIL